MSTRKKQLLFAGAVVYCAFASSRPAVAQTPPPVAGAPVTVQNTAANPVPVTGSTTVTGNVTITGNTLANPLIVRDVSQAGVQPFQTVMSSLAGSEIYHVPSQSRLVIEFVTSQCLNLSAPAFSLFTTVGGTNANHFFAPTVVGNVTGVSVSQSNNLVRIHADPGTVVELG